MSNLYNVESLTLMLSNKCNLNCWMCDFGRNDLKEVVIPYSIPEIITLLKHNIFKHSINTITFTGGEPLLYKDIVLLFKAVHDEFPYLNINLSTNAVLLDKMIKVLLRVNDFSRITLFVSVDGIHKHDEQRGIPGVLSAIIKNLDTIRDVFPRLKIFIKYTITPLNYMDIEDTFNYFKEKKFITRYKILECNTCYNNKDNYKEVQEKLIFSEENQNLIRTQLSNILNKNTFSKNTIKREIQDIIDYFDPHWVRADICCTPEKRMFIDNMLNVYSCKEYAPILNLAETGIDEIVKKQKFLKIIENEKRNTARCHRCISHMKLIKEPKENVTPAKKKKNRKKPQYKLPFYNLNDINFFDRLRLLYNVNKILKFKDLSQHKDYLTEFEKYFAWIFGAKYAKGVNSGTTALYLALKGIGLKEGDEVITVANTFISTVTAIVQAKAHCIFAEIIPETGQMDINDVKKKITDKTAAIVPVHMYGNMADMAELIKLCREKDIFIIEDSCQAIGSLFSNRYAGVWGDVGCFSFHANKIVGFPGDGGMIITNSKKIYSHILHFTEPGWNQVFTLKQERTPSRLSILSIPIIKHKIENLEKAMLRGERQYNLYKEYLKNSVYVKVLQPTENVKICYRNVILICENRDELSGILSLNDIPHRKLYPESMLLMLNIAQIADIPETTKHFLKHHIALPVGKHITKNYIKKITKIILSAEK